MGFVADLRQVIEHHCPGVDIAFTSQDTLPESAVQDLSTARLISNCLVAIATLSHLLHVVGSSVRFALAHMPTLLAWVSLFADHQPSSLRELPHPLQMTQRGTDCTRNSDSYMY